MIELFPIEFWIAVLFFISFFLIIFLLVMVRKMNRLRSSEPAVVAHDDVDDDADMAKSSAGEIIEILEPLMEEARKTANRFDKQIKEKKRLLKELNDALDTRIININILLSRADNLQKQMEEKQKQAVAASPVQIPVTTHPQNVMDQQKQIIQMYHQKLDADAIAERLSVPKGEVQLVIELKKKFLEMEKNTQ